uniref:Uncharacterized protein n=1 Tax=viral metagenome TaxID=1070528 RepID=A0A6H2A460_9ZZZZ
MIRYIAGFVIGMLSHSLQVQGQGHLIQIVDRQSRKPIRYQWFPANAPGCQACGGEPCPCLNWRL